MPNQEKIQIYPYTYKFFFWKFSLPNQEKIPIFPTSTLSALLWCVMHMLQKSVKKLNELFGNFFCHKVIIYNGEICGLSSQKGTMLLNVKTCALASSHSTTQFLMKIKIFKYLSPINLNISILKNQTLTGKGYLLFPKKNQTTHFFKFFSISVY